MKLEVEGTVRSGFAYVEGLVSPHRSYFDAKVFRTLLVRRLPSECRASTPMQYPCSPLWFVLFVENDLSSYGIQREYWKTIIVPGLRLQLRRLLSGFAAEVAAAATCRNPPLGLHLGR